LGDGQISVLDRQSILEFHRQQNELYKKTEEEQPSINISMSLMDDGQDRSQQVVTAFYSPSMNSKKYQTVAVDQEVREPLIIIPE